MRAKETRQYMKPGIVIFLSLLFLYSPSKSCTCYAVYTDTVFYGMNFDYPDIEMRFTLTRNNNTKIMQFGFVSNNQFLAVCGMNDKGVFSSIQSLYPEVTSWPVKRYDDANLYDVYINALRNGQNLHNTMVSLKESDKKILHINGGTFHNFFADKYGTSFVLEVGEQANHVTEIKENYQIMTNFAVHEYAAMPPDQASGVGADRYKMAHQYIQAHSNAFNFTHGFETLKKTIQTSSGAPTLCSMLFYPDSGLIYMALKRNFSKIWKISITDGTIETYMGFDFYEKKSLNSTGVLASVLLSSVSQNENSGGVPTDLTLHQNWPNPFNPYTHINYELGKEADITVTVYDLRGVCVATLVNNRLQPGKYTAFWDGRYQDGTAAPSGIYFYRLEALGASGTFTEHKKMTLVR